MINKYVLSVGACVLAISSPAFASKKWECAEWICIPTGFMAPNCEKAHKAMIYRILRFKSPVPSFSSCASNGKNEQGFGIKEERMALWYPKLPDGGFGVWKNEPDLEKAEAGVKLYKMNRQCNPDQVELKTEPWICIKSFEAVTITSHGVLYGNTVFTSSERAVNLVDPYDYVRDNETGEMSIAVDSNEIPLETITETGILEADADVDGGLVTEDSIGYEAEGENVVGLDSSGVEEALSQNPTGMEQLSGVLPDYSDEELSTYSTTDSLNGALSSYSAVELPDYSSAPIFSAEDWANQSTDALIENNAGDLYTQLPGSAGELFSEGLSSEVPEYAVDDVEAYLNGGWKSE